MLKHNLPLPLVAVLLLGGIGPRPALAHRLNVVAPVQGQSIAGEAYYADGSPARNAKVTVFDPAGGTLGETATDGEGRFVFPLHWRCDHRVVVDSGDGHEKNVTVPAKEIPTTLPAWRVESGESGVGSGQPTGRQAPPDSLPSAPSSQIPAIDSQLSTLNSQLSALSEQVAGLRKEVARYENKIRLHDVLGGIGCILGLMGLAFYFLGVRRRQQEDAVSGEGGQVKG
jgi:nickel transport protein